jgi:hypothetical protein
MSYPTTIEALTPLFLKQPPVCNAAVTRYLKDHPANKNSPLLKNMELIGSGMRGRAYKSRLPEFPDLRLVVKEQEVGGLAVSEFEALKFLAAKMESGELPWYYIYMYGSYGTLRKIDGKTTKMRGVIIERADMTYDEYISEYELTTKQHLELLYKIAYGVDCLEKIEMNHGDLYAWNVMLKLPVTDDTDSQDTAVGAREPLPEVKFIDFDEAFKDHTEFNYILTTSSGKQREDFYVGLDMNRFFDDCCHAHKKFTKKMIEYSKIRDPKKRNEEIECLIESSPKYPQEIIDFIYSFNSVDCEDAYRDMPHISGENVMKGCIALASELGMTLFTGRGAGAPTAVG